MPNGSIPDAYLPYAHLQGVDLGKCRRLFQSRLQQITPRNFIEIQKGKQGVVAQHLPWDSAFFGRRITKVEGFGFRDRASAMPLLQAFEQRLKKDKTVYVFAFVPTADSVALDVLGRNGWSVIERRQTYERTLKSFHPSKRYTVRLASAKDIRPLQTVCAEAVNPDDRFHADPFFPRKKVDAFMKEWVRASIADDFADAVLIPGTSPHALNTMKYGKSDWARLGIRASQIVLTAVAKSAVGWYPRLISESLVHLKEEGADCVSLTTQVTNRVVIKTLNHLGFHLRASSCVLRKIL